MDVVDCVIHGDIDELVRRLQRGIRPQEVGASGTPPLLDRSALAQRSLFQQRSR